MYLYKHRHTYGGGGDSVGVPMYMYAQLLLMLAVCLYRYDNPYSFDKYMPMYANSRALQAPGQQSCVIISCVLAGNQYREESNQPMYS